MSEHLVCACGTRVPLTPGQSICPSCGAQLSSPADAGVLEPVHVERVEDAKGHFWKLTCPCDKRLLVPRPMQAGIGRCPKCGRKVRVPAATEEPSPGSAPVATPAAEAPLTTPEDDLSDILIEPSANPVGHRPLDAPPPPPRKDMHVEEPASRAAALRTADILRSSKVSERTAGPGLISAWPLAGPLPRTLAGFIDFTLGLVAAMLIIVGGSFGLLPETSRYWVVPVVAFFTAVLLNDCLLQASGGSIGKRLVVLTLRSTKGQAPSIAIILLRAVLKWLLIPGWFVAYLHPDQRALHDLICDTCVLKGRVRHG